jgi:hypothetical protein
MSVHPSSGKMHLLRWNSSSEGSRHAQIRLHRRRPRKLVMEERAGVMPMPEATRTRFS